MDRATPGPEDVARVKSMQAELAELFGQGPGTQFEADPAVLAMAARMRVFVEEIARLTLWHRLERAAMSAGPEVR